MKLNPDARSGRESLPWDNIFLAGFMGAGKSTLGARLADCLGWVFRDTDLCIELKTGKKTKDFFQTFGEMEFRSIETEVIQEVCSSSGQVIALGGGALLKTQNLEAIHRAGKLIYLRAGMKALVDRLKAAHNENRPLLLHSNDASFEQRIENLLQERLHTYKTISACVDTDQGTINDTLETMLALLRSTAKRGCS